MRPTERVGELVARAAALLARAGVDAPRLEAELLMAEVLGWERWRVMAHPDHPVPPRARDRFHAVVQRRCRREPLARILGRWEFWSLEMECHPACLVPRPETELLVEKGVELARSLSPAGPIRILELGTGTGCVAVALARELPDAQVVATDISRDAVSCARRNLIRHGVGSAVQLMVGDWLGPLAPPEGRRFHLILTNPPYIAPGELDGLEPEVREWEPALALLGGEDGLEPLRAICRGLGRVAAAGAWFLSEIGWDQAEAARRLAEELAGAVEVEIVQDLAGRPRLLAARLP